MPKAKPTTVRLYEPDGERHTWHFVVKPIKRERGKTVYGYADFAHRTIVLNSRISSSKSIFLTLLHECVHVATGMPGSEWLAQAIEANTAEIFTVFKRDK